MTESFNGTFQAEGLNLVKVYKTLLSENCLRKRVSKLISLDYLMLVKSFCQRDRGTASQLHIAGTSLMDN